MLTVHLLQAGAQEAEDASGAAAIMWLQGDTQGAVHTLLQPLARGADAGVVPAQGPLAVVQRHGSYGQLLLTTRMASRLFSIMCWHAARAVVLRLSQMVSWLRVVPSGIVLTLVSGLIS